MRVIYTVDSQNGLSFNNRRIVRDRVILEDICKYGNVCVSSYTKELFDKYELSSNCVLDNSSDTYFVELNVNRVIDHKYIVIYNVNRMYPSDKVFDIDLRGYILTSEVNFKGSSHELITKYVYERSM